MTLNAIKTAFLVMLAALFGAGQVCACASSHATSHDKMAGMDHASHQERMHHASHNAGEQHGGHEALCEEDCAHCNQTSLFQSANLSDFATVPSPPAPEKLALFIDIFSPPNVGNIPKPVISLAWLDPPPITPVTLKIRLLI